MIKYISTDLKHKSGGEGGAKLGVWAAVPEMGSSKKTKSGEQQNAKTQNYEDPKFKSPRVSRVEKPDKVGCTS